MTQLRIFSLGEILWDMFPEGARFGGAPANFACHCASLGAEAVIVSAVGKDELGEQAIQELRQRNVCTDFVQRSEDFPTGQVQVTVDSHGKAAFAFHPEEAWDHLTWSEHWQQLTQQADAVAFGTLGQRNKDSRETIQRFVQATPSSTLRVYDINLRPPYTDPGLIETSLQTANLLKLNDEELPVLAKQFALTGNVREQLQQLRDRFGLSLIALTRGAAGALLLRGEEVCEHPGFQVQVRDTVGAGDAFTAALVCGLLRGNTLETITAHACRVAAWVCTQPGATPPLPEELRT